MRWEKDSSEVSSKVVRSCRAQLGVVENCNITKNSLIKSICLIRTEKE